MRAATALALAVIASVMLATASASIPTISGLGVSDADAADWSAFVDFTAKYDRTYEVEEKLRRFRVFQANMRTAEKLTREHNGAATFGVTRFSDLTPAEFASRYLSAFNASTVNERIARATRAGTIVPFADTDEGKQILARSADESAVTDTPSSWDWNAQGKVTPVRDQGDCGCCWAFSTCAEYESQMIIKGYVTGTNLILAPQQLVDCDTTDSGCGGGFYVNAWQYIYSNGGIMQEPTYPYTGQQGTCQWSASNQYNVKPSNGGSTTPGTTPSSIFAFIASHGPASAAIDATPLQHYTNGVLDMPESSCPSLNHAVTITGYNSPSNYYIVKNSWSDSWGMDGYFYITPSSCLISSNVYGSTGF